MAWLLKSRMKVLTLIGLSMIGLHSVLAQDGDSLRTEFLSEVVIEGSATEADTLQNFYRSNMSSTIENILSRMKGVTLIRRGAYGQEPLFRGLSNGELVLGIPMAPGKVVGDTYMSEDWKTGTILLYDYRISEHQHQVPAQRVLRIRQLFRHR